MSAAVNPSPPLDPLILSDAGPPNVTPANTFVPETFASALIRSSKIIGFGFTGTITCPAGSYLWQMSIIPGYALATAATWHVLISNSLGLGFRQVRAFDNSIAGDPFDKVFTFSGVFQVVGASLAINVNIACTTANQPGQVGFTIVQMSPT